MAKWPSALSFLGLGQLERALFSNTPTLPCPTLGVGAE
jgi:hypothetical protein